MARMKKGRPPKSRETRAAEGGKIVDIFNGAPKTSPIGEDVRPPLYLDKLARVHFVDLAKLLKEMGLAAAQDVHAIAGAAMLYSIMRRAWARVKRDSGMVQTTQSGYSQPTAWLNAFLKAEVEWNKRLDSFGLTPQGRASLTKPGESEGEGLGFLDGAKG